MHAYSFHRRKAGNEYGLRLHFFLPSNLSHIVFPLINHQSLFGSILIGPFLMEKADSTLVLDIGRRYPNFTMEDLMELYDDASGQIPM